MTKKTSLFALAAAGLCCTLAQAETGKLLLTGGVSSIDGTVGGGLTPWAVIGTNATAGQIGASAYLTRAKTKDYALTGYGAALAYSERVELSQVVDLKPQTLLLGATPGKLTMQLDVVPRRRRG